MRGSLFLGLVVAIAAFFTLTLHSTKAEDDSKSLPYDSPELHSIETKMIAECNAFRTRNGLPALKPAAWLMERARLHTAAMVRNRSMYHSSFGLRENVAMGQRGTAAVTQAWENSSGHRTNMASRELYIGVAGYVDSSGTPYWTQVFDSRAEAPTRSAAPSSTIAVGLSRSHDRIFSAGRRLFGRLRR